MRYYHGSRRRRRVSIHSFPVAVAVFTGFGLLMLILRSVDPPSHGAVFLSSLEVEGDNRGGVRGGLNSSFALRNGTISEVNDVYKQRSGGLKSCATVEEMGEGFKGAVWKESLRVRRIIQEHFAVNGASRIQNLPPEQFCIHGFVFGKSSEAGFGNEMYKILNAAALSIMLNRSLIIGQTRGKYPFGNYISYSNHSFTLKKVKHLWRKNGCVKNYGRHLVMRIDDFEKPAKTNVLCSNWRKWKQPIIWFQNTTDAVACQFFLKNVYRETRDAASDLFGKPEDFQSRPNVFGELMKVLVSPSEDVVEAVSRVLGGGADPDVSLHMRMLMNRSVRATQAALNCIKKALRNLRQISRPRVVLVSDTPSFIRSILPNINGFAEVLYFDYKHFQGNISQSVNLSHSLDFRVKDWGPAPRWVAFVDFFLASRAKHTVVSGAQRRVGTTYAQLIAALAAANHLGENSTGSSFSFLSSFQSNLLTGGLKLQVGWGHVWNRFAGPLSCRNQPNQCAFTPLLPPAWWDGLWQSPIPRDIRRLMAFGIKLSGFGTVDEAHLRSFCKSKKSTVKTVLII
ncbi:hypothetical protein P3X46_010707 [Hevea brasiliensis]|uniref:Uncharacterized protein n=1 Tax=Hevea brasiliensis TaxID=3981 RepID=A0ABQ9MHL6_HEVBR|nr:uncharacterized protein LOC110636467 [Hevea brasiliensis]KAJ9178858.1 hypothetical protein P3X46_010707 [Hevea brasiliensis]